MATGILTETFITAAEAEDARQHWMHEPEVYLARLSAGAQLLNEAPESAETAEFKQSFTALNAVADSISAVVGYGDSIYSHSFENNIGLGTLYARLGRPDEALRFITKAQSIAEGLPQANQITAAQRVLNVLREAQTLTPGGEFPERVVMAAKKVAELSHPPTL